MKINELLEIIDSFAPFGSAFSWDNCGLIVGDAECEVTKVYISLDADMYALCQAKALGCNTVVCHHPLIFGSVSKVTADIPAYHFIREGINVISVHTPLDMAVGGVNDMLAQRLELCGTQPFYADGLPLGRIGFSGISDGREFARFVKNAIGAKSCACVLSAPVSRVCVIGGSGGSELCAVKNAGCDTLVTGEAKHDCFLTAEKEKMNLLVLGHFETENIVLDFLYKKLSGLVCCHKSDRQSLAEYI